MPKITLVCLLLFALSLPVVAQEETPEAVAKAYIAATQASDWAKAAAYLHPDALGSIKRTFSELLKLDKKDEIGKELFGLKSNAEFEQLNPTATFERVMLMLLTATPQLKEILSQSQSNILGKVAEPPDLVHIVYRTELKIGGATVTNVETMSLKKSGDTWRLLLSGDMEAAFTGMAQALEAEMKKSDVAAPPKAKRPVRKE